MLYKLLSKIQSNGSPCWQKTTWVRTDGETKGSPITTCQVAGLCTLPPSWFGCSRTIYGPDSSSCESKERTLEKNLCSSNLFGGAHLHKENVPICYSSTLKNGTIHHQHSTQQHNLWICHGSSRATSKGCQGGKTNDESQAVCPGGLAESGKLVDNCWYPIFDIWLMVLVASCRRASAICFQEDRAEQNIQKWTWLFGAHVCVFLCVWDWWHVGNPYYFHLWFGLSFHMNLASSTPPPQVAASFKPMPSLASTALSSGPRWLCRISRAGAASCRQTPCGSCLCVWQLYVSYKAFNVSTCDTIPCNVLARWPLLVNSAPPGCIKQKAGQSLTETQSHSCKLKPINWVFPCKLGFAWRTTWV